jgi:aspartate kinase
MTYWGAKVLHYRSVELAAVLKIPLLIGLAHGEAKHSLINDQSPSSGAHMYEQNRVLSVNSHKEVRWISVSQSKGADLGKALSSFSQLLSQDGLPQPQLLDSERTHSGFSFLVTAPAETMGAIEKSLQKSQEIKFDPRALSTVTATCQGAFSSNLPEQMALALSKHAIEPSKMIFGPMSITVVVENSQREKAAQTLHQLTVV